MPPEPDDAAPATDLGAAPPAAPAEPAAAAPEADAEQWVGDPHRYVEYDVKLAKGEGDVVVGEFAPSIEKAQVDGKDAEFEATEVGVGLCNVHVKTAGSKDGDAKVNLSITADG